MNGTGNVPTTLTSVGHVINDVSDRTPFWRSFTIFACVSGLSVAGAAGS